MFNNSDRRSQGKPPNFSKIWSFAWLKKCCTCYIYVISLMSFNSSEKNRCFDNSMFLGFFLVLVVYSYMCVYFLNCLHISESITFPWKVSLFFVKGGCMYQCAFQPAIFVFLSYPEFHQSLVNDTMHCHTGIPYEPCLCVGWQWCGLSECLRLRRRHVRMTCLGDHTYYSGLISSPFQCHSSFL